MQKLEEMRELRVSEDVMAKRDNYGWQLRISRDKVPTGKHPNPIGKSIDITYHSTLEQVLLAALDKMPDYEGGDILSAIKRAKEEILYALQREVQR